jgi:tRNA (guanine26-N2/guanine27-N2)-dimethyltransferase
MKEIITEGSARIGAFTADRVSKKLPVFYNPVMKLNRDISILLLNALGKKDMQIADPLAGSGVRGVRFLLELDKGLIRRISMNDLSAGAAKSIAANLKLNGIKISNKEDNEKIAITNEDANLFLLKSTGFDYIDIDPFGSPAPFLDSAIKRISRGGILAVTATDTAALAGSSRESCLRKYWAVPMRNELMHEVGIRILIRRVQLIGAEHEKALTPIFSYTDQHYYRVFFRCEKGRERADEILKWHKFLLYNRNTFERRLADGAINPDVKAGGWAWAGPLWAGQLWDSELAEKMFGLCDPREKGLYSLLDVIRQESKIGSVGFYDIHLMAKKSKKALPKMSSLLKEGITARTHFLGWGIRTKKPLKEFL